MVHVPYRNSMMTMVLRDSLGGNCKTKMIATMSPSPDDLYESLSTCRFAKRVAKIKNEAQKNEVADPAIVIERLKKENAELKSEIALLKGGSHKEHLDPEDIDKCNKMVEEFITNRDPSATIILPDKLQINQCFYHFKHMYLDLQKRGGGGKSEAPPVENSGELADEIQRLRMLVKQRDNEILILVNLLNKKKTEGGETAGTYLNLEHPKEEVKSEVSAYKTVVFPSQTAQETTTEVSSHSGYAPGQIVAESLFTKKPSSPPRHIPHKASDIKDVLTAPVNLKPEDLMDRTKAFEMFRKSYRRNEAMEENKALLKEKFAAGKKLGQEVNVTRGKVKELTNKLEDLRKDNALRGMVDKNGEIIRTPEEDQLQNEINRAKEQYQRQYSELKDLKADIERIQVLLERSKDKMQKDFEQWFGVMLKQYQGTNGAATPTKSVHSGTSVASTIKDPKVNESLAAFYKARDEIYQSASKKGIQGNITNLIQIH
eukprot:TRINITY_DN401_c1_g1_i1.p1 TRINITY_DN401_c1_g1~~TRINITY_DN401_c1_g1_i1.p1  ORF type:complete len:486 (-),score=56.88 TRINITY_DN401_c1_g1_i1:79-1536(-)